MKRYWLALAALTLWLGDSARAHEFDPGYLSLTESAAGVFEVQWKVSIAGGLYEVLVPRLPAECVVDQQLRTYVVLDAQIQNTACQRPGEPHDRDRRPACDDDGCPATHRLPGWHIIRQALDAE
jgi:hypothetical protein